MRDKERIIANYAEAVFIGIKKQQTLSLFFYFETDI